MPIARVDDIGAAVQCAWVGIEGVDAISDEMRAVVEELWPELAHKLPPKKPQG